MRKRDIRRWRGLKALVHDAVDATTELVDLGHESTSRAVMAVTDEIAPLREPARAVDAVRRVSTRGVLMTIRAVNRAVEVVTDAALDVAEPTYRDDDQGADAAVPMRSDAVDRGAWAADAAIGLVNAAVGDRLADANGLDMGMELRVADRYVPLEREALAAVEGLGPRVALFVHGLGTTEWSWCLEAEAYHGDPGESFGSLLARDLGFTPLYLRYNTGRRISENGRALAAMLERLVEVYPVPIEDLTLIGHSMGGLVLRSACHYGVERAHVWTDQVRRLFCLGSPHRGAPLAKLGHALTDVLDAVDLPATRVTARILGARSAGIQDLRHGAVVDEDWLTEDPAAMSETLTLPNARYYFLSATVTEDPDHPLGQLIGDLLVRTPSAHGPEARSERFVIETGRYGGVMHHQLQNHPAVYAQVRDACRD